jgi:hypothetical protein
MGWTGLPRKLLALDARDPDGHLINDGFSFTVIQLHDTLLQAS